MSHAFLDRSHSQFGLFVSRFCSPLGFRQSIFESLDIGQHQFGFDGLHIGYRIDFACHVCHVRILKATNDLKNGVDFTDMGEELIAEPLPFAGSFDDTGDIHQFEHGGQNSLRSDLRGNPLKASIWNTDNSFIGFDRAKRVIGGLSPLGTGEGIEKCTLANVGQADDTSFHYVLLLFFANRLSKNWVRFKAKVSGHLQKGTSRRFVR